MATDKPAESKFLPPLSRREGLRYPEPGSWIRNASLDKLATLARNLDVSKSKNALDKLHSIPTPWARLLLFESALYDVNHPAHHAVVAQWRGLLGLLGLVNILGLRRQLKITPFSLASEQKGNLRDAFMQLSPYDEGEEDVKFEKTKWNNFSLIVLNDTVLGATSPRTLIFTGMSHECLPSIPFRTPEGTLSDPVEYYKNDPVMLSVIQQWLDILIGEVEFNQELEQWMGVRPADVDAQPISRHGQLLTVLHNWRDTIEEPPNRVETKLTSSLLTGHYGVIKCVESAEIPKESDLFLQGHSDVIVGFRPSGNSTLYDANDRQITDQPVRVYAGHRLEPGKMLPGQLDYLPSELKYISNPIDLLEDNLIEVQVTLDSVYYLSHDNKFYLLPFRKDIVKYFNHADLANLAAQTRLTPFSDGMTLRVDVTIPLIGGRRIKVYKNYAQEAIIKADDYPSQNVYMWPDFACADHSFNHYFYYVSDVKPQGQVEFTPISNPDSDREISTGGRRRWYMSRTPLQGFIGSVGDNKGMLLIKYSTIDAPDKLWKVGVDFGSTHTTIFYREVVQAQGGNLVSAPNSTIEPLFIRPRVKILTQGDQYQIQQNFFYWSAGLSGIAAGQENAFPTQLIIPANKFEDHQNDWLPREGQVFLSSLLDINPSKLETDLKWNSNRNDYATRAFLRSLLILIEAEAVANGAKVALVEHAYPTAFPVELIQKHKDEWMGAEGVAAIPVNKNPLSESVAVCRHLLADQTAKPQVNTIAFDLGGSTTDIGVWTEETLRIQESVKMGAGAIGRYIESENPPEFSAWFEQKLKDQPFNSRVILPPGKLSKNIFHAALNRLGEYKLLEQFIDNVKASKGRAEVKKFLSYVIFIIATVSYYAGLLTRKAKIEKPQYYLYFCGRGGQLFNWIPSADKMVQEMYLAGLTGPEQPETEVKPTVISYVSKFPKQEVGRGLLIDHNMKVQVDGQPQGMLAEAKETVTAGEEGYESISWRENLSYEKLASLKVPHLAQLKEIGHFVKSFVRSELTKDVAEVLQISKHFPSDNYRDALIQRLANNVGSKRDAALIEPLFITEAKVLLEVATNKPNLFD